MRTPKKKTGPAAMEDIQERSRYGNLLRRHIDASRDAVGALADRWDVAEALYNLDPNATQLNIVDGLKPYPIPLWKPKADRIIGTVFSGITGIEPYVQVLTDDGTNDRADSIEKSLQLMAGRGNTKDTFDRAFLQCISIAVNTNLSVLYVYKKPDSRVCFKPVHPKDFVAYPHEMACIEDMVTVGHRFYRMSSEIEAKQLAGEYYDAALPETQGKTSAETGRSAEFGLIQDSAAVENKDAIVCLYQLLHRCDLGEGLKWYRFTLAYDSSQVLECEPFPYSRPWYFDIRFADEYGTFWPASSPGFAMQAIQKAYTDIHNVIIHGSYATAFPSIVFEGGAMPAKMKRSTVGAIYELPTGTKTTVLNTQFKGEQLFAMIPQLEKAGDAVTRISQLGVSQQVPASTTATASAGMLKAQEEGKDQYTAFVAPGVADVWRFLYEMLELHFDELKRAYGPSMLLQSKDELSTSPLRFEPTGKSAETNPRILLEKMQMLLGMASNASSQLDYQKVEEQVVQNMNVPVDIKSLEKDSVAAAEQMLQAFMDEGVDPQVIFATLQELLSTANAQMDAGGPQPPNGQGQPGAQPPNAVLPGDGNTGYEGSGIAGPN